MLAFRNPEHRCFLDLNPLDPVATSERPLAQPVLALSSKLKHLGRKTPSNFVCGAHATARSYPLPLVPPDVSLLVPQPPWSPGHSAGALPLPTATFASLINK